MTDEDLTDQELIDEQFKPVPCVLCFATFRRITLTLRYCKRCLNGFCEGQHGSFAYGHGSCVVCGAHKSYKTRQHDKVKSRPVTV